MLRIARISFYGWFLLLLGAAAVLFIPRWLSPAGNSEDYGAGIVMLVGTIGVSALGLLLAVSACIAYAIAWRRQNQFLRRDKIFSVTSAMVLAAFSWPVSWLIAG